MNIFQIVRNFFNPKEYDDEFDAWLDVNIPDPSQSLLDQIDEEINGPNE